MNIFNKNLGQVNQPAAVNNPSEVGYFYGITLGPGGIVNGGPVNEQALVTAIGNVATYAPTAAQSGSSFLLNRAAGTVVTLPAPAAGLKYTFIVLTSVTSNNYKIITSAGTVFLQGTILVTKAADGTNLATFGDGATHVAVTMNGTTTGGLLGTRLTFECLSATEWEVTGFDNGSSTIATPFATS